MGLAAASDGGSEIARVVVNNQASPADTNRANKIRNFMVPPDWRTHYLPSCNSRLSRSVGRDGDAAPAPSFDTGYAELQHYEVSFYTGCTMDEFGCRSSVPSLAYVVFYDYDPSELQGFVYLPGKDDEISKLNR